MKKLLLLALLALPVNAQTMFCFDMGGGMTYCTFTETGGSITCIDLGGGATSCS